MALAEEAKNLRALLAASKEPVPYAHGDDVGMYCGKAGRVVIQHVRVSNHNDPKKTLHVFCTTGGCMGHWKVADLPKRYRVSQRDLEHAAAKALPRLLEALDGPR